MTTKMTIKTTTRLQKKDHKKDYKRLQKKTTKKDYKRLQKTKKRLQKRLQKKTTKRTSTNRYTWVQVKYWTCNISAMHFLTFMKTFFTSCNTVSAEGIQYPGCPVFIKDWNP